MKSLRPDYWICDPLNLPTQNSEEPIKYRYISPREGEIHQSSWILAGNHVLSTLAVVVVSKLPEEVFGIIEEVFDDPELPILFPDADLWVPRIVSKAEKYGLDPSLSRTGWFRNMASRSLF